MIGLLAFIADFDRLVVLAAFDIKLAAIDVCADGVRTIFTVSKWTFHPDSCLVGWSWAKLALLLIDLTFHNHLHDFEVIKALLESQRTFVNANYVEA